MNLQRWIARRQKSWDALEALLQRVEKRGLKSLSATEIRTLASLYRSVAADLARARTQKLSNLIVQPLQTLTSRGYTQIYQGSRRQEWRSVWEFCRWGFPAVVQQSGLYVAVATALGLGAGLISWWFAWRDPTFLSLMVPESLISIVRDQGELWTGSIIGIEPFASSNIMINNIRVAFSAVAGGMVAGLITVFILIYNGLAIGAIGALVGQNGLGFPFWAFVFPHGALEIPAIFLSGAAGLLLARGLLFPGRLRRVDALRQCGLQAVQLVYGIVPMLVIAGIIEGFFSPSPIVPDLAKYLFGIGLFSALVVYLRQKRVDPSGNLPR